MIKERRTLKEKSDTKSFNQGSNDKIASNAVKKVVEYAFYAAAFIAFYRAKTSGLSPFAIGLFTAAVFCEKKIWIIFPFFVLSVFLVTGQFSLTIQALITATAVSALALVFQKVKKRVPLWLILLVGAIGQASLLYFIIRAKGSALKLLLEIVLAPLFSYICVCAFRLFGDAEVRLRPTAASLGCGGVVLCVLFCGISTVSFFKIKLSYILAMLFIGLSKEALGKAGAVFCAVCIGVGSALYDYSVISIAFFAFISCVYSAFSDAPRPIAVCSALLSAVCFTLYLDVPYKTLGFDLIALSIGSIAYCVIPKNRLAFFRDLFPVSDASAVRSLINGGREAASEEMLKTAAVFEEMSRTLTRRAETSLGLDEVRKKLYGVCDGCDGCNGEALDDLIRVTVEKGRASVNEVAELIKIDCPRASRLISVADEEIKRLNRRITGEEERALRRKELALQLSSVSSVLKKRAALTGKHLHYDPFRANALLEELSYHGVPAVDVMVQKSEAERIMTVVVDSGNEKSEQIAAVAGKLFHSCYAVESVKSTGSGGRKLVTLREKTAYDAVFASACISKHASATGDTHSFIKISDTKFMMALCDGMGSGERAGRISETAIDLVECFFKAGFDGKFVLENVNRFLAMDEEESFAAFDILVCDLNTLERVIIKMGSPTSYIKKETVTERIEGSALPLGALMELKPFVSAEKGGEGETIVFVSDGVSDALTDEGIAKFIAYSQTRSVKKLCDELLSTAKERVKEVNDDMTVVAVKIIKRVS